MSVMAVTPIATPVRRRRTDALGSTCRIAEADAAAKLKPRTDTMNTPSEAAAIKNSGQVLFRPRDHWSGPTPCSRFGRQCHLRQFLFCCLHTPIGFSAGTLVTNGRRNFSLQNCARKTGKRLSPFRRKVISLFGGVLRFQTCPGVEESRRSVARK